MIDAEGLFDLDWTRRELLWMGATAALGGGCGGAGRPPLPEEVLAFHRESRVFDLHVDSVPWMRLLGYDLGARHENRVPGSRWGWHMDLPRAREGGLDGAAMGIPVNPERIEPELPRGMRLLARLDPSHGIGQTLDSLAVLEAAAARLPERLVFARSGSELAATIASGRFAALAALEGAHGIGERVENLQRAHAAGLRMLGLVHFQRSAAAAPMTAPELADRGLSAFGFELVEEMETLGMVVDLAHVNAAGVDDALDVLKRPFVVSHSACRALCDWPRNLDDDQIRRIADRGGVIGVAVGRNFLGRPGLDGFLDHLEHLRRVGGADCVAIGSDWDGGIVPARGLEDVRALPWVTAGLLARDWPERSVRQALGENALRVVREVCG